MKTVSEIKAEVIESLMGQLREYFEENLHVEKSERNVRFRLYTGEYYIEYANVIPPVVVSATVSYLFSQAINGLMLSGVDFYSRFRTRSWGCDN